MVFDILGGARGRGCCAGRQRARQRRIQGRRRQRAGGSCVVRGRGGIRGGKVGGFGIALGAGKRQDLRTYYRSRAMHFAEMRQGKLSDTRESVTQVQY